MNTPKEKIKKICPNCGKEFYVTPSEDKKYKYCSLECRKNASNIEYNCDYCGKKIWVSKSKVEKNKRGVYCSQECSEKSQIKGKWVPCDNCGKMVYRTQSNLKAYNHVYCCNQCNADYNNKTVEKFCEYCGKRYIVKNEYAESTRFCSIECKNKWQSTLENCGINNPRFNQILINCSYCGKEFYIQRCRISDSQPYHFCSYNCRDEYYKIKENRTEKQRAVDMDLGKNAIKYIKSTLTHPHQMVLNILDKNHINYEIEYLVKYFKMDVYLSDYGLSIEVQGDFWHCSPLRFSNIQYEQQLNSIRRDKSKHTYIKRYCGYEILYLWENDINKRPELCQRLILEYINNNGVLSNYQSFNYEIVDNKLRLNKNIVRPFQDMKKPEIEQYIDIKNAS